MKQIPVEAVNIMHRMPGTWKQLEKLSDNELATMQRFCDKAQLAMIDRHLPAMSAEDRLRAEQVKAGTYRGLAV